MESIFVSCHLKRVAETGSVLCIGLNPSLEYVPPSYRRTGNTVKNTEYYLFDVIEVAARLVPVVQFKMTHYSALGREGKNMLERLIECAHHRGLLVILDANQADMGSTMEQYGNKVFGRYGADACTFVPYLGPAFNFACWMGWLRRGHMVISTIQTSNLETQLIQGSELPVSGLNSYEDMATRVAKWNAEVTKITGGAGGVGAAIEATSEQVLRCRELAGDDVFFLIPDYGVQDCGVELLLNGRGQVMGAVNSLSDSILYSWRNEPRKKRPLESVEAAIKAFNTELNVEVELGKILRK